MKWHKPTTLKDSLLALQLDAAVTWCQIVAEKAWHFGAWYIAGTDAVENTNWPRPEEIQQ
jgi:hypothetical protein